MRNLTICKLVLILSAIMLLASCDTGYSGDVDPNSEVFNYKYPLKKGNVWEYLSTQRFTNFSNDSVAATFGADTVKYCKIKYKCSYDSVDFGGIYTYQIDAYRTDFAANTTDIDTNTYQKITTYFNNNSSDYYFELFFAN